MYDSNIGDVGSWLDGVIDEIGWDMPAGPEGNTHGSGSNLAEAVIDTCIDGIQARALARSGADANGADEADWPENAEAYRRDKRRRYGESNPNFRTTQMLSRESLKGTPQVGREDATWRYGTGRAASNARTRHDRQITDVRKAELAHEGQSEHRIMRPFFAVAERDADDALIVVESAVVAHIQRKASE